MRSSRIPTSPRRYNRRPSKSRIILKSILGLMAIALIVLVVYVGIAAAGTPTSAFPTASQTTVPSLPYIFA